MRILYVARHDQPNTNDDEGSVTHSLLKLGHDVQRVREVAGMSAYKVEADFMLCHHWHDIESLARIKIPKVCWCFDLIRYEGGGPRHDLRVAWATEMKQVCDLLFHTDGNWVDEDTTGKLRWLTQGADERPCKGSHDLKLNFTVGSDVDIDKEACAEKIGQFQRGELRYINTEVLKTTDVLFVGGVGYGRDAFVREMRERYGERFKHILKGCHGSALADEVNRAKVVVCPDTPVTDRYFSNRLYNMLRLDAFLLHPYSEAAYEQYDNLVEWYKTRDQMHRLIKWALNLEQVARDRHAACARIYTEANHTYTHRCVELVRIVQETLCLKTSPTPPTGGNG